MPKSPTDKRHFIIAGVLVLISTLLLDWLLKIALPLPVQASVQAITIDQLIHWHITVIAFLFSVIVVFMLYSVVVFRRRAGDESEGAHFEGNSTLEIVWTVLPLIIVVVFVFIGINTYSTVTASHPDEMAVKAVGFQWSWRFEYPEGAVSQELVLPVDTPIRVDLESIDVLHSFWIPEMRVKQDLVPGDQTVLRFTPQLVGEYKLRCAEICGLSHWSMLAPVRIVEQSEYQAWLQELIAQQNPGLVQADAGQPAK
jgi:cytochrome c oxidase subunit II